MASLTVAIQLAKMAHGNQKDKSGKPYTLHLERVAKRVGTRDLKIVAWLHDIIEDTETTEQELIDLGFSDEIVTAVKLLTKTGKVRFPDPYFTKIKGNFLARTVKLADLTDNMDISRIPNPTERDHNRCARYRQIYDYLSK